MKRIWVIGWVVVAVGAAGGSGTLGTAVGTSEKGYDGDRGPASKAHLNNPFDVAFDEAGNLYLSDTFNHCVRRVDAKTNVITTVAGTGKAGDSGDGGPALKARFNEPYGIAVDRQGNLFVADRLNRKVRRIDGKSGIITTLAGDGSKKFSGDGGPANRAGLVEPNSVALARDGKRLFIADVADHRVRVVDLETGTIDTLAGDGKGRHAGDGGPARKASIAGARAVDIGPDGTIYLLERQGNTIRAIDPRTRIIRTIGGTGAKGYTGDGGPALSATFNGPKELAVDAAGNLFVVDTENHAIRRIDARTHLITTVAGNGVRGGRGDGGPAASGQFARPHGVAVRDDGAVFIGDTENHRIRFVSP